MKIPDKIESTLTDLIPVIWIFGREGSYVRTYVNRMLWIGIICGGITGFLGAKSYNWSNTWFYAFFWALSVETYMLFLFGLRFCEICHKDRVSLWLRPWLSITYWLVFTTIGGAAIFLIHKSTGEYSIFEILKSSNEFNGIIYGNIINGIYLGVIVAFVSRLFILPSDIWSALRTKKWDFFFSYKSENANEVRRIAERLMANGYRIWFAEYEIMLLNYEDFEPRIRQGIQNCSFGILFTTTNYSQSSHCCDEVCWLQQRFTRECCRIIEVSLEPNNVRHALGLSPQSPQIRANLSSHLTQKHDEDDDLLIRLAKLTGLELNRGGTISQLGGNAPRFRPRCANISFDPSGFVQERWETDPIDGSDIVSFANELDPVRFSFNVYFQNSPEQASGQPFTISADSSDDKRLYAELRTYASWFMKQVGKNGFNLREQGLHLIWIDGRTQLALTHSSFWGEVHMRKYSVILSQLSQPIQLIFTFAFSGSFDDFFRYVPLMDRVIESVRVDL